MATWAYLDAVGEPGRRIELAQQGKRSWRIGRGLHNDINLDATMVSRNHALIQAADSTTFYLSDLGSQNGTYANQRPVTAPVLLHDGDVISIADHSFDFHLKTTDVFEVPNQTPENGGTAVRVMLKVITVLVVDLRGFTEIASEINVVDLAQMMGAYFRQVGDILRDRKAWTQKYIGDAVLAIWVHEPDERPGASLLAAVDALAEIQKIASELQLRFKLSHPVRIGAGLNTGIASVGNIGGSLQADHTALGETVIKAFRLEKVTRDIGIDVAVGVEAASELERMAGYPFLSRCVALLKGYSEPCPIYGGDILTLSRLPESTRVEEDLFAMAV